MILQELAKCYDLIKKSENFEVASFDHSIETISFRFKIGKDGLIKQIYDLRDKKSGVRMEVPIQSGRTSGIKPYFLCDNSKYLLGYEINEKTNEVGKFDKTFEKFKEIHEKILSGIEDEKLKVFLEFLNKREENFKIAKEIDPESLKGGRIVISIEGEREYIHTYPDVKNRINLYKKIVNSDKDESVKGNCLISGEKYVELCRIHQNISGVAKSSTTGASIISFNGEAFESYGKVQSYNAGTSEISMFKYTTALNTLLKSEKNSKYLSGNTVVFWSDEVGGFGDGLIDALLSEDSVEKIDNSSLEYSQRGTAELESVVNLVKRGMTVDTSKIEDDSTNLYILGLAGSKSRIFVRFWFKNSVKEFVRLSNMHFEDTKLVRKSRVDKSKNEEVGVKISYILKSVTPNGKAENVPSTIINSIFKSILTGSLYPTALYSGVLLRIRAEAKEDISVNHTRVSFIKGYLKRYYRLKGFKDKEEEVTVSLNLNSNSVGYNLGRIFAILERIQYKANDSTNIREKYLSSASSTPKNIFPILLNLSQHHISKVNKNESKNFNYYDKIVGQVISKIDEFPSVLSTDEQGMFMLGYYHQREDLFTKKDEDGEEN